MNEALVTFEVEEDGEILGPYHAGIPLSFVDGADTEDLKKHLKTVALEKAQRDEREIRWQKFIELSDPIYEEQIEESSE